MLHTAVKVPGVNSQQRWVRDAASWRQNPKSLSEEDEDKERLVKENEEEKEGTKVASRKTRERRQEMECESDRQCVGV